MTTTPLDPVREARVRRMVPDPSTEKQAYAFATVDDLIAAGWAVD